MGKFQGEVWYKHIMPNVHNRSLRSWVAPCSLYDQFRMLRQEELPPGFDSGSAFTSVCINTSLYLPYLVSQCLKNGVVFERHILDHVSVAKTLHHSGEAADVVVNCTGISARKLGGVMDQNMMPARGQTVLVRNTADVMCDVLGIETGDAEVCYVMQRAAGG